MATTIHLTISDSENISHTESGEKSVLGESKGISMTKQIVKYDITDAVIEKMRENYMPLKISGINDKENFTAVHEARMVVKNHRVRVEQRRKELKVDALEYGRRVDGEAKRIFNLLEPIEKHLQMEENRITEEKERIKEEARQLEENRVNKIKTSIETIRELQFKAHNAPSEAITEITKRLVSYEITHEEFQEFTEEAKSLKDETVLKLKEIFELKSQQEKDDAKRKAENERLEKIRIKQEADQKIIDDERAKLEADKQAEQDRLERLRIIELRDKNEKDAKARQDALKPDREKIIDYAEKVLSIQAHYIQDNDLQATFSIAIKTIQSTATNLKTAMEE